MHSTSSTRRHSVDDALSIRLAEIEYSAKRGIALPAGETLVLVSLFRGYMAYAETANRAMEGIQKVLDKGVS